MPCIPRKVRRREVGHGRADQVHRRRGAQSMPPCAVRRAVLPPCADQAGHPHQHLCTVKPVTKRDKTTAPAPFGTVVRVARDPRKRAVARPDQDPDLQRHFRRCGAGVLCLRVLSSRLSACAPVRLCTSLRHCGSHRRALPLDMSPPAQLQRLRLRPGLLIARTRARCDSRSLHLELSLSSFPLSRHFLRLLYCCTRQIRSSCCACVQHVDMHMHMCRQGGTCPAVAHVI